MPDPVFSLVGPLRGPDLAAALALAATAGLHGVYVRNALTPPSDDVDVIGFRSPDGSLGAIAWFGMRGNLMVIERGDRPPDPPLDGTEVVDGIVGHGGAWRIVLGPAGVVAALVRGEARPPLVDRWQIHYGVRPGQVDLRWCRDDVRLAVRQDARALVRAAIDLNEVDLNVARWRVHLGWLRSSVRRRIREGRTWVTGPAGTPSCKLDVGSRGPAGVVLEGVHTDSALRGRGLASGLVATVAQRLLEDEPLVCLHVAESNHPARRAYERAGMIAEERCRLMLRG